MDGAPVRSRTSQSPSPSHSTASASSSAHHKRGTPKFPPPPPSSSAAASDAPKPSFDDDDDDDGNDTEEPFEDEDTEEPFEDEDADMDEDEDEDNEDTTTTIATATAAATAASNNNNNNNDNSSSMRTFTAARFDQQKSGSGGGERGGSAKPPKSEVKVEAGPGEGGGSAGPAAGGQGQGQQPQSGAAGGLNIPGIVVKDDPTKGIFTENIQTSGAYSAREEGLKREEDAGRLKFMCCANDGIDEHMIWLIGLKNIFARQLPNMPKEYIVRLVMDRSHKSMMVIRYNLVVGGITYRPYISQRFGEIAFCAITADEQVKGYGTRLMNHLKQHARDVDGLTHFLTYADNNAVGYFIKQGFTKEITLEKERWHGYIKDYDGGILMECKINPKLPYTDLSTMIRRQRQAIDEKIRELSNCHIVYPGIDFQKKEGIPRKPIKVEDIPGLREAGWTPDQYGHSRYKPANATDSAAYRQQLNAFMRGLLKMMNEHPDAWPFREPVDSRDVPDYYDVIKDPMDLRTMSKRLESEQYYITFEMFVADVKRMFANAHAYNSPETIYYKCATRLENYFSNKVQAHLLQTSSKNQ